jgi:hypothetical protein
MRYAAGTRPTPAKELRGDGAADRLSAARTDPRRMADPGTVSPASRPPISAVTFAAPPMSVPVGGSPTFAHKISAPLTTAAIAGRARVATAGAPVVHVTIDRIDMRAPAAARTAPPERRPRPQPSVSLADYLGGGKGARA